MTTFTRFAILAVVLGAGLMWADSASAQVLNYRYYQPTPVRTYAYYPSPTATYMVQAGATPVYTAPVTVPFTAGYPVTTSYYAPPVTYAQPATVVVPRRYVYRPRGMMYVPTGPAVYVQSAPGVYVPAP